MKWKLTWESFFGSIVSSREGIALNKAKFYDDDRMISERINTGQHLNQILPDITASKSSVYRYFNKGYLSASKIDLIFSHVHSVKRPVFNNRTPYEMMAFLYSEALLGLFGIHKVAAHKVIQTPKLQKTADFKRTLV